MKCKNCGINYDDDEHVCPMCGTRAGCGHTAASRYTTYQHQEHSPNTCTHKSYTREYTTTQRTQRPQSTGTNRSARKNSKNNGLVIVVIVCVLLMVLPAVVNMVSNAFANFSEYSWSGNWGTSQYEGGAAPEDTDDTETDVYVSALDLFGGALFAQTADGGELNLTANDEDEYQLSRHGGDWDYTESGWLACFGNSLTDEEEQALADLYPVDQFDLYRVSLYPDDVSTQGNVPEALAADDINTTSHDWILAISKDTGEAELLDGYQEDRALFGGELILSVNSMQAG